jgi:hypothetical protein
VCIAGRILGYCEHGPTFFVREILDGIAAQPGGDYSFISTVVGTTGTARLCRNPV